ncbi:MAG: DUF4886 domain-containing protein [Dysgonamonadaceae bacterium]|jgi:hypothetical protein|nr:DUF4886 domain-containing protein [Dysgonamonadaceae bacterium]
MKKILIGCIFLLFFVAGARAQDTIRILAIGNSFSEDAVENYLYELGRNDGITFIIGNLYIGGCSLERHWNNATNDKADYAYRKIGADGLKTVTSNVSLQQGISDEKWDYISLQQNSGNSGQIETYAPYLSDLKAYAKKRSTNREVVFLFHQTWAYAEDATHEEFPKYHNNQEEMYRAIVESSRKAARKAGIRKIVPCGTAIQNGRNSFLGDVFCRDGYHLSLGLGRYTAACTWFEYLTGHSVVGNRFIPSSVIPIEAFVAQRAAHRAVQLPYRITPLLFFLPKANTKNITG